MPDIKLNLITAEQARKSIALSIVDSMSSLEIMFMVSIMSGIEEESEKGQKSYRLKFSNLLQWSETKYSSKDYEKPEINIRNLKIIELLETLGYKIVYSIYLDEVAIIWGL